MNVLWALWSFSLMDTSKLKFSFRCLGFKRIHVYWLVHWHLLRNIDCKPKIQCQGIEFQLPLMCSRIWCICLPFLHLTQEGRVNVETKQVLLLPLDVIWTCIVVFQLLQHSTQEACCRYPHLLTITLQMPIWVHRLLACVQWDEI